MSRRHNKKRRRTRKERAATRAVQARECMRPSRGSPAARLMGFGSEGYRCKVRGGWSFEFVWGRPIDGADAIDSTGCVVIRDHNGTVTKSIGGQAQDAPEETTE